MDRLRRRMAPIQVCNGAHDLYVQRNHQWKKTKPNSRQRRYQVDDKHRHRSAQPRRRYRNQEGVVEKVDLWNTEDFILCDVQNNLLGFGWS